MPRASSIPLCRPDGYLPEGVYLCSESEVISRFGSSTPRRRRLAIRLRRWIRLARQVSARRLLVDGSFVTEKANPHDIDSVVFLPADFEQRLEREEEAASWKKCCSPDNRRNSSRRKITQIGRNGWRSLAGRANWMGAGSLLEVQL